jgi:hypothetical protein
VVQRRTRRPERWEGDLIELANMHDEQMGAPLDRHSGAVIDLAVEEGRLARGEPDGSWEKFEAAPGACYAWDAIEEPWHKMLRVRNRVYLVSRDAPRWTWMSRATDEFDGEFRALNPRPSMFRLPPDLDVQDASTRRLVKLHDDFGEVIHKVSDTMRPPQTYPWRRWWIFANGTRAG